MSRRRAVALARIEGAVEQLGRTAAPGLVRPLAPLSSVDGVSLERLSRDGMLSVGQVVQRVDADGWVVLEEYRGTVYDADSGEYRPWVRRRKDLELAHYEERRRVLVSMGRDVPDDLDDRLAVLSSS